MNREYFELFVSKSKDYYLDYFDNYEKGKKIQFNLAALLFGLFWFLYRKMYLETFILFTLISIESYLENLIVNYFKLVDTDASTAIQVITTISIGIMLGLFGNLIYIKHANRIILSITNKYQYDEQILKDKIQNKGGTSFLIILILFALFVSLIVMLKT